jgi:hypothetical protein
MAWCRAAASRAMCTSRARATPSWCWSACGCCCGACRRRVSRSSWATSCWTAVRLTCPQHDPGRFDGEPLRPYNAAPDALLLNYKSVVMTLCPMPPPVLARIQYDPPLAGVQRQATVPLAARGPNAATGALPCAPICPTRCAPRSRAFSLQPVASGSGLWRMPILRPSPHARWRACGASWGASSRAACARARCLRGCKPGLQRHVANPGRGGARRQQVQQQRDGAARVSDAGVAEKQRCHAGWRARSTAPVVARALWRCTAQPRPTTAQA